MLYFEIILLGISLSIDAFSLAISLSLSKISKINYRIYALSVAMFHFMMPCSGYFLRFLIKNIIIIPDRQIIIVVLIIILIGIIFDNEKKISKKLINPILFAFSVSLDSFSIGLTLNVKNLIPSCITFSIISGIFTYAGFIFGSKLEHKLNSYAKILSILILIILLIYNVF